ncbi:YnbE family lipoprotein [Kiloniella sp.]|uniref:YnbE family lipoprotein n=1 Tax=Kiloniella sp. TaxID=1938587 RepID=UPI003A8ECB3E
MAEDNALGGLLNENINKQLVLVTAVVIGLQACTPTVKVEAPREPITINLNIKLDAEVRVRLEDQAKDDINNNPNLF